MSMQFNAVLEPDVVITEKSQLSADIAAGVTVITVKNASKFVADKYLCIGELGSETAELRKISSVSESAKTVTIDTAVTYPHYQDNPVSQLLYNKRRFYRYNSVSESWEHLTAEGSPKDIEVDNQQGTYFEDSSGTTDNEYKATYFNSAEAVETSLDDARAIAGGGEPTNLISLFRIRYSAGFKNNYFIEDGFIDQYRQEVQGEIWAALRNRYQFPLTKYSSFLTNIVKDLAVGAIWLDQYSGNADKVKEASDRIKDARERLDKLANGTYILYDEDAGEDQTETGRGGGLSYFPDENTDDTDDERIFTLVRDF